MATTSCGHTGLLQVFWTADDGARAARLFHVEDRLLARVPDLQDASTIERALDRARYQRMNLDHKEARLIAAHLQHGPGSSLYRFAVTGEIRSQPLTHSTT